MAFSVSYIYELVDKFSGPASKIERKTQRLKRSVNRAAASMRKNMQNFSDSTANAQNAIGSLGAAVAVEKLVSSSLEMEDALADIARVSDLSGDSLGRFRTEIETLSDKLGKSSVGLAQIAFEGKKLGTTDDNLLKFVNNVVKMAVAFDMAESEAGKAIGSIKSKVNLSIEDISKLTDSINFLADNTTANGRNMINIIERISGSMKTINVPPEAIAALASFADQLETSPELAASGINMMMNRMMRMPGMMKKLLSDPLGTVRNELQKLADMPESRRVAVIFKRFGDEAGRFVLKASSGMEKFDDTVNKAFSTGAIGSMDKEMKNRAGRTSTALSVALESMTNTFSRLGDTLKPVIVPIANGMTAIAKGIREFVVNNPKMAKFITMMIGLAAVALPIITVLGFMSGAFAAIISPIGLIITGIATTIALFSSMASENESMANALGKLWDALSVLVEPFGLIFGMLPEGTGFVDALAWSIGKLADLLNISLTPLRAMVGLFKPLLSGTGGLADGLSNFGGAFSEGFGSLKSYFGFGGGENVAAQSAAATSNNLNGRVVVEARPGSQVSSATLETTAPGNLGMNIAAAGAY